jgi:hypothetical protein
MYNVTINIIYETESNQLFIMSANFTIKWYHGYREDASSMSKFTIKWFHGYREDDSMVTEKMSNINLPQA